MRALRFWGLLLVLFGTLTASAQENEPSEESKAGWTSELLSGLTLRGIGPAFMSGRIVDIAVDPVRRSTWYVAAASGGVWKTENAGTTWTPIFDDYGSYSIGCVAVDPHNRHVVWVGTGENNSQRSVGYGDGLYKSLDGGRSFSRVGLDNSEHIARILIDPRDSEVVYVAAQGPLWAPGGDRGLYKTTDGGKTWQRVLEISENTGVTDVHFDPRDPDTLYAAAYQRRRHVWTLIDGGPECGIYKSTDAGASWRKINRGLPSIDLGRIGLTVSPMRPDVLYAIVEAADGQSGFYRSADRGENWSRQSDYISSSPQYYQEIYADPHVFDRVYSMDVLMMVSDDGGKTFNPLGEQWKHVDNHALVFDPGDPEHLLIGCDGGLYETWDRGQTYDFKPNLPLTQFYKIAVDNDRPFYNVYGGTQDNATQGGPSRTTNVHGIRNSDWFVTVFGDGFDPAVDPQDPNLVYSQWQYGGLVRFDRRTSERVDIKPREALEGPPLRWNWDSALLISPHSPARLYYAAQMLFRSDDRGDSWRAVSPDLTRNLDRNKLKVMGRVWSVDAVAKNNSTSFYGTIVSLSESPLVENLLYAGTDDGLIQITEDGGENWRRVDSFPFLDVPDSAYINDIEASRHDAGTVYVAINNHKNADFRPYLLRSTDRGRNWTLISRGLPERGSVHTIAEDHQLPGLLFAGTEFGVWCTLDGGLNWMRLKSGLPTIAVRDLEIQRRENDLIVGTFGRGFYILDDYSPLRELAAAPTDQARIFPVKKSWMYIPSAPLAGGEKAYQGAAFYTAPNPPFGATITYYLPETLQTRKGQRQEKESELAKQDKDVFYPSWDELKAEDREENPAVVLTIRDRTGEVVRRLNGPTAKGIHRIAWNFRYPSFLPTRLDGDADGPMALPGKYTVELARRVDGQLEEAVPATPLEVEPLGFDNVPEPNRRAILAFQEQTGDLQRAVFGAYRATEEAQQQLRYIKATIERTPQLSPELRAEARGLELRLLDLMERFEGDSTLPKRSEPGMPGILDRLQTIVAGHWSTTAGPTATHRKSFEIVADEFEELLPALRQLVEKDLVALTRKLEAAKAPWTPGQGIPRWQRP